MFKTALKDFFFFKALGRRRGKKLFPRQCSVISLCSSLRKHRSWILNHKLCHRPLAFLTARQATTLQMLRFATALPLWGSDKFFKATVFPEAFCESPRKLTGIFLMPEPFPGCGECGLWRGGLQPGERLTRGSREKTVP